MTYLRLLHFVALAVLGAALLPPEAGAQSRPRDVDLLFVYDSPPTGLPAYAASAMQACQSSKNLSDYINTTNNYVDVLNLPQCAGIPDTFFRQTTTRSASISGTLARNGQIVCLIAFQETVQVEQSPECGPGSTNTQNSTQEAVNIVGLTAHCSSGESNNGVSCTGIDPPTPPQESDCSAGGEPVGTDVGNPTSVGTGCKREAVSLGSVATGTRRQALSLQYANLTQAPDGGGRLLSDKTWFLEPLDRGLVFNSSGSNSSVRVRLGDGGFEEYARDATNQWVSPLLHTRMEKLASSWRRIDFNERHIETYDADGRLTERKYFEGGSFALSYPGTVARPTSMTFSNGRIVTFSYLANGVGSILLPGGGSYGIAYYAPVDPLNPDAFKVPRTVTFPDLTTRTFDYEAAVFPYPGGIYALGTGTNSVPVSYTGQSGSPTSVVFARAMGGRSLFNLIGITDEAGVAVASFGYDSSGRVISSKHAGETNKYLFSYSGSTNRTVTDPLGSTLQYSFTTVSSTNRLGSFLRYSAGGALHTNAYLGRDAAGNINEFTELTRGRTTCVQTDPALNRETVRVEGLPVGFSCATNLATYSPLAGTAERKISRQWTSSLRLEKRRAEPKRITTWVYNGEQDPTAGNAVASCAPASALLPTGVPIAVVCKIVEQGTSDASGGAGFAATAVGAARIWAFTYNADGQILTENGPRTDVADMTTYEYYAAKDTATPVKFYRGDLKKITNAAGHVTDFLSFDGNGQPLVVNLPNGSQVTFSYHPRQWLAGISVLAGGVTEATTLTYHSTGRLNRITLPSGGYLQHGYDPAQRLTSVTDNLGNRVDYTLDVMGNRTAESWKDQGAVLRRSVARTIDSLNRVQSITGAPAVIPLMSPSVGAVFNPSIGRGIQ